MNLSDSPEAVRAYLTLTSSDDKESAVVTFAETARVTDDGHTYEGEEEIRTWLRRTSTEFTFTSTPVAAQANEDATTTVTCRVEGTFPGSPITLAHHFRLDEKKRIANLTIEPHNPT